MTRWVLPLIVASVFSATAAQAESPLDAFAHFIQNAGNAFAPQPPARVSRPSTSARPPLPTLRPDEDAAATAPADAPPPSQVALATVAPVPAVKTTTIAPVPASPVAPAEPAVPAAPVAASPTPVAAVPAPTPPPAPLALAPPAASAAPVEPAETGPKPTAIASATVPVLPPASPAAIAPVVVATVGPVAPAPTPVSVPTAEVNQVEAPVDAPIPTYHPRPPVPANTTVATVAPLPATVAPPSNPPAIVPTPAENAASRPSAPTEATTSCAVALAAFGVKAEAAIAPTAGGCRVASPVNLSSAGDIALMPKALIDCATAATLSAWLQDTVAPKAQAMLGAKLTAVRILDSYDCRTVDNLPGANLSEHSRGKAIDIGAFHVGDRWITVGAKDLTPDEQAFFDAVRASACGPFTTVLGPGADQYHTDNLHLDTEERQTAGPSKGLYCQ